MLLDNHKPEQSTDLRGQLRDSVALLKTPVLRTTVLSGTAIFAIIFGVFLTALPLHLEQRFGLSAGWRGAVLAVPAISSTLVAINIAGLREKLGLRGLLVAGSGIFAVAFVIMGSTPVLALAVIAAFAYGLGEGALIPTLQDVAASVPPDHLRGAALAAWVGAGPARSELRVPCCRHRSSPSAARARRSSSEGSPPQESWRSRSGDPSTTALSTRHGRSEQDARIDGDTSPGRGVGADIPDPTTSAEREGFEPSNEVTPVTSLAGKRLQPDSAISPEDPTLVARPRNGDGALGGRSL